MPAEKCKTLYNGPSYPQFRGAQCEMDFPHIGHRHVALINGNVIRWWSQEDKQKLAVKHGA